MSRPTEEWHRIAAINSRVHHITMKHTLEILTSLLAELHVGCTLRKVPIFGILQVGSYEPLETYDSIIFTVWN